MKRCPLGVFSPHRMICALLLLAVIEGCSFYKPNSFHEEKEVHFTGSRHTAPDVQLESQKISSPILEEMTPPSENVSFSRPPRTLRERLNEDEVWDIPLQQAIQMALANNKIVRRNDRGSIQGNSSFVLNNPEQVATVYDPAIQQSGVLFGGRGVEAALAAFDAQLSGRMNWGRSETVPNNLFFGGGLSGNSFYQETSNFVTQLSKTIATGGQFAVSHSVDYNLNNSPSNLFGSAYTMNARAEFRQPLLQGAGVEFTRIAGPISSNFQGLSGVNQGVAIARINGDITLTDFEDNVTGMVYDVERAYWDLYKAYRRYDATVAATKSVLRSWRKVKALKDQGARGGGRADEAQANATYYERRATEEAALANIDSLEASLRRMCGLPVSDGKIIRPIDDPTTAEFVPDWHASLADAISRRVELRRSKWAIKSLELQLRAAKNLVQPRLDFVASYQVNGFGDRLLSESDDDGITQEGFHSAYENLTQGNHTGWTLGGEFAMPLGFRSAHTQVRNLELRLAKARKVLAVQEEEIAFELSQSFQDLSLNWANSQTNFNRRRAAENQVQAFEAEYRAGTKTLDLVLQAQSQLANAETAYYDSLTEYNKSISHIHLRKGTLLELNSIMISEGEWDPEAQREAYRRAWARTFSIDTDKLHHEPEAYAVPGDSPQVELIGEPGAEVPDAEVPQPEADSEVSMPELEIENPESVPEESDAAAGATGSASASSLEESRGSRPPLAEEGSFELPESVSGPESESVP